MGKHWRNSKPSFLNYLMCLLISLMLGKSMFDSNFVFAWRIWTRSAGALCFNQEVPVSSPVVSRIVVARSFKEVFCCYQSIIGVLFAFRGSVFFDCIPLGPLKV
jgi:hypothetical protein